MEYVPGDDDDERLHKLHHREYLNGMNWTNVNSKQLFVAQDRSYILHLKPKEQQREWTKVELLLMRIHFYSVTSLAK